MREERKRVGERKRERQREGGGGDKKKEMDGCDTERERQPITQHTHTIVSVAGAGLLVFLCRLTVERLHAGRVVVDEGRRHPDDPQDEKAQQEQHHEGLQNPRPDTLGAHTHTHR